jgi:isopentenyl-diphosphate delta-isomerase
MASNDQNKLHPAVLIGLSDDDPTAVSRKKDHIELAFKSRVESGELDSRFYYEPMLAPHPAKNSIASFSFLGKTLRAPMWVSSMTGGTALANIINHNLARVCAEFGLGMGLGSCRQLLYSDEYLPDFDVRDTIGADLPLYANLGIAQIEQLFEKKEAARISILLQKLRADGLIVHVNPLQEAMQPEGDIFKQSPLETIQALLKIADFKVIVKEVGQGFGPESLRALMQLPIEAIEFAAAGGTNFAKLELLRNDPVRQMIFEKIAAVGHSAEEMLGFVNALKIDLGDRCQVKHLIISGGVRDFLDGYYLIAKSALPAVYGQASGFLKHARGEYAELRSFVETQVRGLELAQAFLRIK